ncbi:MAG: DUF72 domain-containing protein [Gammaproteobacteria bacterium]|nr:MAG: DUF72 domain-containing protein [Gammaproteobacteria bacterium]
MQARPRVAVGTCGFAESQHRTWEDFDLVEIQQTFYEPPRPATARRWREAAPERFFFTLKAWQLITHPATSPTYRRLRTPLGTRQRNQAGSFRWNPVTRMAWERTLEIAEALEARLVLLQAPASFRPTPENLDRLHRFCTRIDRPPGLRLAFEPRGTAWTEAVLRPLLAELDLVHAVDPFLHRPLGRGLRYFRLHGRPAYHYAYRYTDADLDRLLGLLNRAWPNWVLFNNVAMAEDARRFRQRLESCGGELRTG